MPTATVTVLFTDLVDSTGILARLGDDAADDLSRLHLARLRAALARHDGMEVRSEGDGLVAVFASASAACAAAVEMQQAIERLNRGDTDASLSMRIGMSLGEASSEGSDWFGTPVVEAARLCDQAAGGQILVADVVRVVTGTRGDFTFRPAGDRVLKGLPDPLAAAELVWAAPPAEVPLDPVLEGASQSLLVGRQPERDRVLAAWKAAATGSRRVVMLGGEPGIGKTRLAADIAARATADGGTALYGRCDEGLDVAYQPIAAALRQFARARPDELVARLGPLAQELVRLVPELAPVVGEPAAATTEHGDLDRLRLFDAVVGWLAGTAEVAPVVLVLDDLHWASPSTVLLLRHVVRASELGGVLIVGTYRDTEVTTELAELLADLWRESDVDRVALTGLDIEEVADFTRAAGPDVEDLAALARAVHDETDGNPFFVREVLRHLGEEGPTGTLPASVRDVVERRLGRLAGEVRQVLATAAVAGPEFDLGLLEATAGVEPRLAVLDHVEAAMRAGLVTEAGRPGQFAFTHALVRQTLLDGMGSTRRARLHGAIAEALESGGALDVDPAVLAHHYAEAAVLGAGVDRAVDYAERAARRMLEQLAYEPAVAQLERAVDLVGVLADRRRSELLTALADARWKMGDRDGARQAAVEAADRARSANAPTLLAGAALSFGRPGVTPGVVDDLLVLLLEEALDLLAEEDVALRAMVGGRLAMELYYSDERVRRETLAAEAVGLARRVADPIVLARALDAGRFATWSADNLADRIALSNELVETASAAGDRELLLQGRIWRVVDQLEAGGIGVVDDELARVEAEADALRQPGWLWYAAQHRAMRALLAGRFEEGEALADAALAAGQGSQVDLAIQAYGVQIFLIRWEQGRLAELADVFTQFVAAYPAVPAYEAGLALLHSEVGAPDQAEVILRRLSSDGLRAVPDDANRLVTLSLLAKVSRALGAAEIGGQLAEALRSFADHHVVVGPRATACLGAASSFLGDALLAAGDRDAAAAAYEAAILDNDSFGAPSWADHARYGLALARDDRELARDVAASASARGQARLAAQAAAI